MFVLDPSGTGLLLTGSFKTLAGADWGSIALVSFTAAVGIVALAGGLQGWLFKRTSLAERIMLVVAGFLLVYPKALFDAVGFVLVVLVLVMQWVRRASTRTSCSSARAAPGSLPRCPRIRRRPSWRSPSPSKACSANAAARAW